MQVTDIIKELDELGSELNSILDYSSSSNQKDNGRETPVKDQSNKADHKEMMITTAEPKKKVVMVSPVKSTSPFPDLESASSRIVDPIVPKRTDKRPMGILKPNTRIPLDFKKDYLGVLYSPILENRHAIITEEMEKRDSERFEKWTQMMSQSIDGWDVSVSFA